MDSFRQHSNPNLVHRQQVQHTDSREQIPPSQPGGLHTQQQLPSFKEILPPPHQSTGTSRTQYLSTTDAVTASSQQISRSGGPGLPSPNYSQSSSMPDSFDDFSHRNQEPVYSYPVSQRQPPSLTTNQSYSDMATYATQRPYQNQQLGSMGRSPGLPPIRDIDHGLPKLGDFNSNYVSNNGYASTMYPPSLPNTPQYGPGDAFMTRRSSGSMYDNKPVNPQYSNSRPYPPIKPEFPAAYPPSFDPYARGGYPDYQYHQPSMSPAYPPSMPPHLGDGGDSRNRRRRGNLPKATTDLLRSWFQKHLDHPYPSDEEKQMLILQTGLSMNQISNWFINARRRHLPALRQAQARDSRSQDEETQRQQR